MINSHYVPQLILRHFTENDKIQYCDLDNKRIEPRNVKSTFSEKGYYPDEIEKEMCYQTESQFANLLNNKLLREPSRITLTSDELFILKKYLIITTIRYNCIEAYKNYGNPDTVVKGYEAHFFDNINQVLACQNKDELAALIGINPFSELQKFTEGKAEQMNRLFVDVKNILHSYIIFVSSKKCGEHFIIPDTGFAFQATHLALFSDQGFDKCTYTLQQAMQTENPYLMQIALMLTPYDMFICPVSNDLAIISLSSFFKFFNKESEVYGMLSTKGLTVNQLLGFGSATTVSPPKVRQPYGKPKEYTYKIQKLSLDDVISLNARLLHTTEHHLGFSNIETIRNSLEYYMHIPQDLQRWDLSFMLKKS